MFGEKYGKLIERIFCDFFCWLVFYYRFVDIVYLNFVLFENYG